MINEKNYEELLKNYRELESRYLKQNKKLKFAQKANMNFLIYLCITAPLLLTILYNYLY